MAEEVRAAIRKGRTARVVEPGEMVIRAVLPDVQRAA